MFSIADIADDVRPAVKVAVRVSGDALDLEVDAVVSSAIAHLRSLGVSEECFEQGSEFYPVVRMCVITYAKAHFGMDNPNAEMDFWDRSWKTHIDMLLNSGANSHAGEPE